MAGVMENKRVLVTGVSGFAGSYLATSLSQEGAKVYGLVRRRADGSIARNIKPQVDDGSLQQIQGDIADISTMARALRQSQPDFVFHLAAQSFVPRSFEHPLETHHVNATGTANLLEAVCQLGIDPVIVFAGSSEEYGLVVSSERQLVDLQKEGRQVFPRPLRVPELPVNEHNPLRPLSPYAVSKVYGDLMCRTYNAAHGLKTVVSRAFNHEGAGRGSWFVTSVITAQVMELKLGERDHIEIGNVNAFRDWSHVEDIVRGYALLALKGTPGEVYNQGSSRTCSVLSYLLLTLENAGYRVRGIKTLSGSFAMEEPVRRTQASLFGLTFDSTLVDLHMLKEETNFAVADRGLLVDTSRGNVRVEFQAGRMRPADVPILLADCSKAKSLGFRTEHSLEDIIRDQLDYYLNPENRQLRKGG